MSPKARIYIYFFCSRKFQFSQGIFFHPPKKSLYIIPKAINLIAFPKRPWNFSRDLQPTIPGDYYFNGLRLTGKFCLSCFVKVCGRLPLPQLFFQASCSQAVDDYEARNLRKNLTVWKLAWQWKITIFNRRYIFKWSEFSIVMFFFDGHSLTVELVLQESGESTKNYFRSQLLEPKRDTHVFFKYGKGSFFWVEEAFSFVFLESKFCRSVGWTLQHMCSWGFFLRFLWIKVSFWIVGNPGIS